MTGVPNEDDPSITATATLAHVQSGTIEKTIQELRHEEEEPTPIDDEKSCTKENEHDQATEVLEAINLPETMSKVSAESVEHADQKSEAQRIESVITKHVDSEEMVKVESIGKESHDVKEVEKSLELPSDEHQEINDSGKIIPEEVLGVPEDKTLQSLPVIASTIVESADKSIQEEIHKDVESAITYTEEGPRTEIESEERTGVLEPRVDHKETENLQVPDIREKLEVKDGDEILQGEAKEMEQATKKQSPEAGIESVPEQEALSTIAKLVTVEGGTVEKTILEQTHEEKEPILIDDNKSCTTENEHEKATNVIEAIDLPETLSKVSVENEENADQKSKEQSSDGENWITNHIDLEESATTENIEKSSYDVKELKKTLELPSAENEDIDDGGKIMPEAAIGVPDGQTLQSLPPLASIGVQNVDRSIQEGIHIDGESAVTDTEEGKTHENELEDKTNSLEAFELHEVIANTNVENEKVVEPQSAASLETTVSIHPNFEGLEKTEINQSNDTEEQENDPESNTGEKLEIKDDPEIIQEEAREKELATEIQLPETVTESVHEQEFPSTVTSPEIVEGGTVDKTIQEQIHEEDQQKLIDDDRVCSSENEHEQAINVLEAIGLSETMSKDSAENEELANSKSEAQNGENVITKHINSEETGTPENIEKPSYDVKDLEKTPELPSAENQEINDRGKIIQEEAIGVPEDQTLQPPLTIESVVVQTSDKSIQEEIHKDGKSAVTDTEEGQTCESEFEGKTNVLEAYDLHKVISSTTEENEKKAKRQSEMSLESTVLKHSNLEGLGTTELNPGNDTGELENFLASDTVEKSDNELPSVENREIKESAKITPVEAIGVPADQPLPSIPTIASIGVETVNYSIPEKVQKNSKFALSDTEEEQKQENKFEDKTNVLKEFKMDELIAITCEENDKKAEPEPEASIDTIVLKHPDLEVLDTTEVNLSNETEEQENVLASDTGKKLEIKDGPQIIHNEAKEIELATENQLPESATETIVEGGTVEKTSPEQTHEEEESKPIDDEKSCSPENEYEQATKVVEAIGVPKTTSKANAENAIQKSEEQSIENVIAKHVDSEELVTLEKSSYDVKDVTPELPPAESQEINDCGKILLEEALGVPRDQTLQPLLSIASDGVKTGDESIQEEIHTHGESTVIDTEEGQTHQIESEDKTEVLEAFDLLDENACTSKENREKAELQSDASPDNTVLKHLNLEALDSTTRLNPSIDSDEPKNVSAPDMGEELEIKDYSHIIQEEAKGVELATERQLLDAATESISEQEAQSTVTPLAIIEGGTIEKITQEQTHEEEDQTLQPLPTTESDIDETVDKSIEEEIHKYGESTVTDTEEGLTHENESVENVLEELDSHEVIAITNKEIEKKVESQPEFILNTTALKHTSLEGLETIEVNPGNETEEPKNVPVSETGKKLEMKDGAKIIEEEENVMELATEKHLLEAPTASINEQEDLLTPVIVEGGTLEKLIQEQAHEEEELTPIDDNKSNTPEIKHEQESIVLEEIDLPKTISTFSAENEEHADQKSEAQCSNVIAKHTDTEEMVTTECFEKSTCDVKLLDKTLGLASAENREINDGKKITSQEAIGVPDNESLQSPPTIACGGVETVDKNIQKETHKDNESAVTETEEEHRHENEYEGKTNVLEAFDLHEVIASTSEENEEKSEPKLEVNLDTVVLKHLTDPSLEGLETTEINKSIDTGHPENVPASYTGEKLEIKDGSEIIQEKAKEMELPTEELLPETTTKSVPEQEALSTMPTPATPEVGTPEKIIQEQTIEEEESTLEDDDKCYTIKNEHESETKVLEVIGLPETMSKVSAENEEHADQKSESQSKVNTITKHIDSQETITTESIETSNDVKELQNIPGVPVDQTLQPLATIASVEAVTIDRSIEEEIHKDDESSETSTIEEKTHENKFEDNVKVLEGFGLHEVIASTIEQNKNKAESKSESESEPEASLNSNVIRHHDLEELETIEINQSNDTEEPENVLASDIEEKLEIKDGAETVVVEAKEMELATEKQLQETATESVTVDKTITPTPEIVQRGTVDKTIQEQTREEDESTPVGDDKSCNPENEVHEESNLDKAISNTYTDNEKDGGKSAAESMLEDEAQRVLVPTSEFVKGERIEKSFHEETLKEEQSTVTDNKLEQTTEVLEPGECITERNFQAEAQRETSLPGTNLVSLNQIESVDLADVRKLESRDNSTTPNKDFSSSTIIDASEGPRTDESKNTLYGLSSIVSQEVEKESKAGNFNRIDIENICDKNDARTNENIEEQTIDNQVKDHNVENFEATESIEQREILDLSFENDPARKKTAPRDSDKAIELEATEKLEIQELETDQIGSVKGGEGEDEFEKISPSSSDNVMIKDSQDSDVKVSPKKHHGILSGVGSKVKHSISKVKKAITGKSSHSKTSSEK
ncbi:unnamed protein product [Lupinus luteus]|uniref:Titin-like n=1 Tax=Lupinus luteus TaxID=3873 RepID=A0AAV1XP15_LUPLU